MMILLSISFTKAQHTLTREANRPRIGDILLTQEVEYGDPGKSGKDIVWNFSKLIPVEKQKGLVTKSLDQIRPGEDITNYLQMITSSEVQVSYLAGDSGQVMRGLEPGFIYSYNIDGDSLSIVKQEWPSTRMEFSLPQVLLAYPFTYKDRITSYYSGYGVYCERLGVKLVGSIETEADGYGTLILPGNDTIQNVLRVKIVKTELEEKEASYEKKNGKEWKIKGDSIEALLKLYKKELPTTEIVCWYAKGYRYPILEMICHYTNPGGNKNEDEVRQAFFYDPIQQEMDYLSNDRVNQTHEQPAMKAPSSFLKITPVEPQVSLDYNIYPNPVRTDLKVDLHCLEHTSIKFSLFAVNNSLVYQSVRETPQGHSTVIIPMSGMQTGQYLLHIDYGKKAIVEKIIKK